MSCFTNHFCKSLYILRSTSYIDFEVKACQPRLKLNERNGLNSSSRCLAVVCFTQTEICCASNCFLFKLSFFLGDQLAGKSQPKTPMVLGCFDLPHWLKVLGMAKNFTLAFLRWLAGDVPSALPNLQSHSSEGFGGQTSHLLGSVVATPESGIGLFLCRLVLLL